MNSQTDQQLLRDYARRRSEAAFAELVCRYIDLVYSAALRMVCDSHLAQDVTQGVFVALAQSARQLAEHPVLSGWLHRTTRNIAANTVRSETRRRIREQEAAAMNQLQESNTTWETIAPCLDETLGELTEEDRDALLLRYFERKSAREMANILGTTEDTAQKRVSRAVERLREIFSKRRLAIGAGGLVALISVNAVQAAPVGLAATISAATALTGTAVQTSTVITATKTIAMTTVQKSIIVAAFAAAAGTTIYAAHQNSKLRNENQTLQQQLAPLKAQVQELQQERDYAASQLNGLAAENAQLETSSNQSELLRLRGEVTRLENSKAQTEDNPTASAANALVARVNQLKQWLDQHPNENIPELQLLTDRDWLRLAASFKTLKTDVDYRQVFSEIRKQAKDDLIWSMGWALNKYIIANNGQLPNSMQDLMPYFSPSAKVNEAMLERYKLLQTGSFSNFSLEEPLVSEIAPVDNKYDFLFQTGVLGYSYQDVGDAMSHDSGSNTFRFGPDITSKIKSFAKQ